MDKVLEIHKLIFPRKTVPGLPIEIIRIIVKMGVNLLECRLCGKVLRRTHKDRHVSWYTDGQNYHCLSCQQSSFSLQDAYKKRFKKNI